MIIRALDADGDWTFGQGAQNYLGGQSAVALAIKTRLYMFQNDCFFDMDGWIDWFNLLGSDNTAALLFSIRSIISDTQGVNSVTFLNSTRDENRNLNISYSVTTVFGLPITGEITFPVSPFSGVSRWSSDIVWTGQTFVDVVVSSEISDARNAIWALYDENDGFSIVAGAVQPLNATTVRVTIAPSPASGLFRLVGIS